MKAAMTRGEVRGFLVAIVAAGLLGEFAWGDTTDALPASAAKPLLGANLQYSKTAHCWTVSPVIRYDQAGVRSSMRVDLAAMRAAGLESFRIFLYHTHAPDPGSDEISSAGGLIGEPYRSNLVALMRDIRDAGFKQVTIAFNPTGPNQPYQNWPTNLYDPAMFAENWSFIREVHDLVKTNGPPSTHFDLLNEGAPNNWLKDQISDYISGLYRDYVDAFGNEDVTISAIDSSAEWDGNISDDGVRMQFLIDALRASGRPLPAYFDVHPAWDKRALDDLSVDDAVLTRNGLSQPLVVGEEGYDNLEAAAAIAEFVHTSSRPVVELMVWPAIIQNSQANPTPVQPRCPVPPYQVDAYATALNGAPPSHDLNATVMGNDRLTMITPYGQRVAALEAGVWRLVVRDSSARANFHLLGPGVNAKTGVTFRGVRSWTLTLRVGATYVFRSDRSPQQRSGRFFVVPAG